MSRPDSESDSQPILVVAAPRSGSSWFAERIAASPSVVYRREPITQWALAHGQSAFAHRDVDAADDAELALIGDAFSPRGESRALVKEVMPLRLPLLVAVAGPIVVQLVRHPLAVAVSQHAQGWVFGNIPPRRFSLRDQDLFTQLAGLWDEASDVVRTVAYTAATVVSMRRTAPGAFRARYEDYQRDDGQFASLARALGIAPPPPAEARPADDDAAYGTARSAAFDPHRWRTIIRSSEAEASRDAWRSFGLDDYPDGDWL